MAWRPTLPPMRHDAPRAFGMGDRAPVYGAPSYAPPYTNIFRPPGVPNAAHFIASRPVVQHASVASASAPAAAAIAASASSSAKAAEALAQQQAADDKKRGYPTIKGKSVAQCKRKNGGTEELKVAAASIALLPPLISVAVAV